MKKIIFILIFTLAFCFTAQCAAQDSLHSTAGATLDKINTSEIDASLYDATRSLNIDFKAENVITSLLSGKALDLNKDFLSAVNDIVFYEIKNALRGAMIVFSIIILSSLISVLQTSFSQSEVSTIANSICAIASSFVIVEILKQLVTTGLGSLNNSILFIKSLGPAIGLLLFSTGQPIAAGNFAILFLLLLEGIVSLISYIFIPLLYAYLAMRIVDSIFDNISVKKIADLIKNFVQFGIGLVMTIFVSVVSIQTIVQNIGDTAANKAVKYTISSAVPVVGKIVADATEAVISFSGVLKSAFGVFGIIGVLLIFLIPIIKIGVQLVVFKVINALAQTLGSSQITKILDGFCSTIVLVFSINICVCIFLVVTLGLLAAVGVK